MKIIKGWLFATIEDAKENLKSGISKVVGYKEETEEIYIYCKNGKVVKFFHNQDCCETVYLESADGLKNNVDIFTNCDWCEVEEFTDVNSKPLSEWDSSFTWTFYIFRTNKGYDTMRWYGTSNGWYSESVDFEIYEEQDNERD